MLFFICCGGRQMTLYSYNGPVFEFEKLIANRWQAQTYAVNEAKARTNFAFQFKKETGRVPRTKITLPGKITVEGVVNNERAHVSP
jgi:hypothetical protein